MTPEEILKLFDAFKRSLSTEELAEFSAEIQAFSDLVAAGSATIEEEAAALDRLQRSIARVSQETQKAQKPQQDFANALQRVFAQVLCFIELLQTPFA